MSKRSERHEAERLVRRRAYVAQLHADREAQTQPEPTVSEARLAANRANAQFSTGPTSLAGKAIASRNHTSHGLTAEFVPGVAFHVLPNENQSAYDQSLADFKTEWKPTTATELDLVERLATHSWLRHRAQRLQDQVVAQGLNTPEEVKKFTVLSRYHTTHERAFNKAFSDLLRLRSFQMREEKHAALLAKRAHDAQLRFESQKLKAEAHAAKMEALRLKQEAQKQRNNPSTPVAAAAPAVEIPEMVATQAA